MDYVSKQCVVGTVTHALEGQLMKIYQGVDEQSVLTNLMHSIT